MQLNIRTSICGIEKRRNWNWNWNWEKANATRFHAVVTYLISSVLHPFILANEGEPCAEVVARCRFRYVSVAGRS